MDLLLGCLRGLLLDSSEGCLLLGGFVGGLLLKMELGCMLG